MTIVDSAFRHRLAGLDQDRRDTVLDTLLRQRVLGLRDAPRPEELPISPAQQRLWFIASTDPDNANYNIPGFFRITGALAEDDLEAALRVLADRHEMLRCRIVGQDAPTMEIIDHVQLPLRVMGRGAAPVTQHEAQHQAHEFLRRPFDLDQAPLWRALLIPAGHDTCYLVLSFHHIIFDGWSLKVFIRELLAVLAGRTLPALDWHYPDYAVWQRRQVQLRDRLDTLRGGGDATATPRRKQLGQADRFWQQYLVDPPAPAELLAGPLPTDRSNDGALVITELPAGLWHSLVGLARAEGATPFAASLAALSVLVHRRSGQDDLIFGTPVSGRSDPDTQTLIGDFVNTIPVRARVGAQMTSRQVLRGVSASSVQAFSHDDVPFDRIVEITNPVRSRQTHPLFQVLFSFQPAIVIEAEADLRVDYLDLDFGTAKFDLSLDVVEEKDTVRLLFEYSTDRFERGAIEDLAASYEAVIAAMTAHPDDALSTLPMLSVAQHETALARSRGPVVAPLHATVPDAVAAYAAQYPQAQAVTAGGRTVSYAGLVAFGETVRSLICSVATDHKVVALLLPRSVELFGAILGVWASGKACLVLDPSLPTERLEAMVADTTAIVLTQPAHLLESPMLERRATAVAMMPDLSASLELAPGADTVAPSGGGSLPDGAAYVVFTSGSTGQPKGISISHRAYAGMLASWTSTFGLDAPRSLQLAASSFDVFYADLARTLGNGGHLQVLDPETMADPVRFADTVRGQRFDFAEFVPSVFRRLADHLRVQGERLDIRHCVVASENWSQHEAHTWLTEVLDPASRLYNSYGVAEATVDSTCYRYTGQSSADQPMPVGAALPNCEVYLLDAAGELVATATNGRLFLGGVALGEGYVGRNSSENVRFAEHDLGDGPRRLYDTGDLAYRKPSGDLMLLGRSDTQVKVRGVRIELGEIEHVVRGLRGVTEAAAMVAGDLGGEHLVAWVEASVEEPDTALWTRQLSRSLPSSMVPEIVVTPALPHLTSGKVDRRALACRPQRQVSSRIVPPRTADESVIHAIFGAVLQVDDFGVTDSFFALGGHSLTALELVSKIRSEFGVGLRIGDLFSHPTVEALAVRLSALVGTEATGSYSRVEPDLAHRFDPFPLTDVQQAYWLGRVGIFEFSGVATHSYDDFHGSGLNTERFTAALNALVGRHEMMRAVVVPDDAQRILPEVPWYDPQIYDLTGAQPAEVAEHLASVRLELSDQQIDMTTWPTFDIRVSLLPGDQQVLHFSTDALMLDAWGFVTIMRDLNMFYDEVLLPDLDFSFRDYVLAEKAAEHTEKYERTKAYWDKRIPTLPPAPELPMAQRPDDLTNPVYTRHHVELDHELWGRLKAMAAARDLTPTTVCLTAYADILGSRVHDPRFCLNLTFLNRKPFHPQVQEIVGEFTSLTLLELDLTTRTSFVDRARTIQRDLWETLEENDMSGVKVLRNYARYHDAPTAAHFPVVFTSALAVPIPQTSEDFQITHQPKHGVTQTSQVWLDAGIWEDQGNLRCNWDVVLDVYPEGLIPQMFAEYVEKLTELADSPVAWDEPAQPAVLTPLEVRDVCDLSLLDLVTSQVRARPEALAVISATATLTYADLAARAAGVARQLREQDLQPGELVGVFMDVGWEQTVAVLGVVSVAAYLPLSPDLPEARMRQITEAANLRVMLTQPALRRRLSAIFDGTVLCVDDTAGTEPSSAVDLISAPSPAPNDLAYVIYTSGSTGQPKGVMIDHRGVVNTILDVNERFGITERDRVLALSALSFDLSVYDIFGLLAAGGTIVLPDPARRLDPLYQRRLVNERRITVWNTVPALFDLFVGACDEPCPTLRVIMLSGDWIPLTVVPRGQQICPGAQLHSLGGATEASIWSITYPIEELDPTWTSIPYGTGLRNQDVVVLDGSLAPAPHWAVGDLYIRGVGLALGYFADSQRTDEAFVRHPVSGERLYRTGDLGRLLPDGTIEFLGRSDLQLKISGYRVEAGDVERAVLRHHAVREAVVLALGEGQTDRRLACLWVPQEAGSADQTDLPLFLKTLLPPYMVPLVYLDVPVIPLSSNGKVDRVAARRLFKNVDVASAPYVAASTAGQRAMTELWSQVLDRDDIGMHDDFFQIGGDSIKAIELVTALRQRFDQPVTLAEIYERRTPSGLIDAAGGVG